MSSVLGSAVFASTGIGVAGLLVQSDANSIPIFEKEGVDKLQDSLQYLIECCISKSTVDDADYNTNVSGAVLELTKSIRSKYEDASVLLGKLKIVFAEIQKQEDERSGILLQEVEEGTKPDILPFNSDDDGGDVGLGKTDPVLSNDLFSSCNFPIDQHDQEELFLDIDGDSEDVAENGISSGSSNLAVGLKKKKKRNKKKKKTTEPAPAQPEAVMDPQFKEDIDRLDAWLAKGARLSRSQARDTTLLLVAAKVGHVQATKVLLGKPGVRVLKEDTGSTEKLTALHCASFYGHAKLVELLLTRPDIQVDRPSHVSGLTPLMIVSLEGQTAVADILLKAGAKVNQVSTNGSTPLNMACQRGQLEMVEKLLKRNEIEANKARDNGETPFYTACSKGHLKIVEKFLEQNEMDVNTAKNDGCTPLFMACQNGHLEIVEKLLSQNKTEVSKAKNDGQTPLTKACQQGHLEIVKKLLDRAEIEVNSAYASRFTPEGRNTIEAGSTALIFAAYFGHRSVVEQLLRHPDIDVHLADDTGATAITIAQREGHNWIVDQIKLKLEKDSSK